jgi:uncharacterized membrane protein YbhN (UPF0104 family)
VTATIPISVGAHEAAPTVTLHLTVARAGLWTLLAAHLVTVCGTSWDIRWHLLIGRDSFWIPPHLMTYSGVTMIVLVWSCPGFVDGELLAVSTIDSPASRPDDGCGGA